MLQYSGTLQFQALIICLWKIVQLRLAAINGPNEGLAIVASLNIITAIFGPAIWKADPFNIGISRYFFRHVQHVSCYDSGVFFTFSS
jgi:hypothetical protein